MAYNSPDIEPEAIAALEDILCSILARLDQEQLSGVIDNLLAYGVGVDALPQKLPSRARTSAYSVLRLALTCIDRKDLAHRPLTASLISLQGLAHCVKASIIVTPRY